MKEVPSRAAKVCRVLSSTARDKHANSCCKASWRIRWAQVYKLVLRQDPECKTAGPATR